MGFPGNDSTLPLLLHYQVTDLCGHHSAQAVFCHVQDRYNAESVGRGDIGIRDPYQNLWVVSLTMTSFILTLYITTNEIIKVGGINCSE